MIRDPDDRNTYIAAALALLFIFVLCAISFVIVRPFIAALLWGVILAIATWPVFGWFRRRLGGRNTLAAAVVTVLLAVVLLGPVALVGTTMTENIGVLGERLRAAIEQPLPVPEFLEKIPVIGDNLAERWHEFATRTAASEQARHFLLSGAQWLLAVAATIGGGIGQLALSILCSFFFFRDGEAALQRLSDVLGHVAGERSNRLLTVAYGTLKGVVYGVLGSALAQACLAGFGYWISGIPAPFLLGVATGFLGIIPAAGALIWLPAAIWLFHTGATAWGVFLILWSAIVVSNIDNVIKPIFISRGSALPLLLVLIGILGGAIAFGFIGIFLGPTVLAILYTLMREWSPGEYVLRRTARPPLRTPVV
jgi:predicted PurR-regulated permease PerM